jgi:predicted nucleic acid-binding protein
MPRPTLVVDANVWVAAADLSDPFSKVSRSFFASAALKANTIYLPSIAEIEVACALARRKKEPEFGASWARKAMTWVHVVIIAVDSKLIDEAVRFGTRSFIRGADALYAATAVLYSADLISWDNELVQRAGAVTPAGWLSANPS